MDTATKNGWPDEADPDAWLTIAEAAAETRLSDSTIYDAVSRKLIAHYRLSGSGKAGSGKILIKRGDLLHWVASRRVEASGQAAPTAKPSPPTRVPKGTELW